MGNKYTPAWAFIFAGALFWAIGKILDFFSIEGVLINPTSLMVLGIILTIIGIIGMGYIFFFEKRR